MRNELTTEILSFQLSRKTVAVLLAILYAGFVVLFPWDIVSKGGFTDFDQYVAYFHYFLTRNNIHFFEVYQLHGELYELSTLKELFAHEALWFELMRWLSSMTGDVASALHMISFFVLFVWGVFLFNRISYEVALLFLLNPFAIDVAMSGVRNGLAWALVILALSTQVRSLRWGLFLTTIFIHSSALVLIIFYYFGAILGRVTKNKKLLIVAGVGVAVFAGLALTVGSDFIMSIIKDRRLGENYSGGGGSFLQAPLWGLLLYLQCTSGREYVRQNMLVISVLAWYLTMNLFIPWSYRIWSAFLPVIASSAMNLSSDKRRVFIYLYSGYLVLLYLYWSKLFDVWYPW